MPHPLAMERLPGIDPRDHAVESRSWGDEFTFYLVRYDGRYYAWTVRPFDDGDHAYEMPSEDAARRFLDSEFAFLISYHDWGDRLASVSIGDQASGQILFSADLLDGAEDGIWLATSEPEGEEQSYALAGFDDLGQAVEAFAARTEQAADTIERLDIGWPQVTARYLRYRAALARAGAARAELGDTIRRSRGRIRAERAVSRVAGAAGVSREFVYHILAGDDWTWKGLMPASKDVLPPRPPARLDPATLEPPAYPRAWSGTVTFAVEAGSEQEASAIARSVLDQMGAPAAISGAVPGPGQDGPVPERLWTVAADFDLSGMQVEPDGVEAFSDLRGDLSGATWTGRMKDRQGWWEWPPSIWARRPGADDVLGHPAIRAARIRVSAGADGQTGPVSRAAAKRQGRRGPRR
jgi:DNA-binding phage protein